VLLFGDLFAIIYVPYQLQSPHHEFDVKSAIDFCFRGLMSLHASYKVLPINFIKGRSSSTRAANLSGLRDCGLFENALTGSWWTSIISPSAPAAMDARAMDCTRSQ